MDEIGKRLDDVASLDQDRILRSYLTLIQATLRTSFYQRGTDGRPKSYVAFKLDPQAIPDLPAPRPKFEIFVYSPRFEGVHLRFGPVARGGLRWSDRREDFRTEVLGLVKAQMVKNAVIVPVGAKGGFVLKQKPGDRDEAVACYQAFIAALLDVTDNIVGGQIVPPGRRGPARRRRPVPGGGGRQGHRDVLRHRQRDLGGARASGWATRSRPAARPATTTRRWASPPGAPGSRSSGTSASWASTPRRQDFTVVGVGDMSGDVFGNGMLLSEHIRLVAAFDHRHIFLDPEPGRRLVLRGAAAAVRPAALLLGGLRPGADLGRWRGLPPYREVDPDLRRRSARRSASTTR